MNYGKLRRYLLLGGIVALPFPTYSVMGATYTVGTHPSTGCGGGPCDYTAIQSAIDSPSLAEGDIISVFPGTYYENLKFEAGDKEITLMRSLGASGGDVIVDGGAINPTLQVIGGQGEDLVIQGIRLTNGRGVVTNASKPNERFGGGIFLSESSPILSDLQVNGNTATFGGGIYMIRSSPVIRNSRVDGNTVVESSGLASGAGVYLNHDSMPIIEDSVISDNVGAVRGGGIYMVTGCAPEILATHITGNEADYGGGVYASSGSTPFFTGVLITDNIASATVTATTPPGGGGVYLYDGASPVFENVTLANNVLSGSGQVNGVELYSFGSSSRFVNSVVYNADADKTLLYGYDFTSGAPRSASLDLYYTTLCNFESGPDTCSHPNLGGTFSATAMPVYTLMDNAGPGYIQTAFYQYDPDFMVGSYRLSLGSDVSDNGDPAAYYNDLDGSRNNLGAYGGLFAVTSLTDTSTDSDFDLMADDWEIAWFGSLVRDGLSDYETDNSVPEADGLTDGEEYFYGTDPTLPDTDRDGYSDLTEVDVSFTNPLDAADHRPRAMLTRDRIALTGETVDLSASRSEDPDGASLTYSWSILSQPGSDSLSATTDPTTSLIPTTAGLYVIRVVVTDSLSSPAFASATSEATVTVRVGTAGTDELLVPTEHATISAAITAVTPGSQFATITVADGTYVEAIDFGDRYIRLRSENGPLTTTLTAAGSSVVTFNQGRASGSALEGFTVLGGTGTTVNGVQVGGGIYVDGVSPVVRNCIIKQNNARYGGGVALVNASPLFESVTVTENLATVGGYGAGFYIYGGTPEIYISTISDNLAQVGGGGDILGGAIYAYGSSLHVEGAIGNYGIIDGNQAIQGGGLYLHFCTRPVLNRVEVTNNIATNFGGGLVGFKFTKLLASNVRIAGNTVSGGTGQGGGAFINEYSALDLRDATVGEFGGANTAVYGGGMALGNFSSVKSLNTTFSYNGATSGGVLYSASKYYAGVAPTEFLTSSFVSNTATQGGVVYLTNSSRASFGAATGSTPSTFYGNDATADGGVAYVNSGDRITLRNSIMQGNSANRGGVLFTSNSGTAVVEHCTLTKNAAVTAGAAIATVTSPPQVGTLVTLCNSVVSHTTLVEAINAPNNLNITYSNFFSNSGGNLAGGASAGAEVIYEDPRFVAFDNDLDFTNDDFHLEPHSLLIDRGTPTGRDLGAFGGLDIGEQVPDGDGDGIPEWWEFQYGLTEATADPDADGANNLEEYQNSADPNVSDTDADGQSDGAEIHDGDPSTLPNNPADQAPIARAGRDRATLVGQSFVLDGSRSWDRTDVITYTWRLISVPVGSASALSSTSIVRPSVTPDLPGAYAIGLIVNDGVVSSSESVITIHANASPWVVGEDASSIQDSIDMAPDWTVIRVPAGTYAEDLTFGTKPLTVESEDGWATTFLVGTGSSSTVTFNGSGTNVVLSGFTVRGGVGTTVESIAVGGGIYLNAASAVIEGCTIRNNAADTGAGIYATGGAPVLIENRIVHNSATLNGGGVALVGADGFLMASLVAKNDAATGGGLFLNNATAHVHFNTVASNDADTSGGGVYVSGGTPDLRNNIVAYTANGNGIEVAGGTPIAEYNLLYLNAPAHVSGMAVSGTNLQDVSPLFNAYTNSLSASALLDDYRLAAGSPAFNSATVGQFQYSDPVGATDRNPGTSNDTDPDMGAFGGPLANLSARVNWVNVTATGDDAWRFYTSIATAMSVTFSGDTVKVRGGTYPQRFSFSGRAISLVGSADGVLSILDGTDGGTVVTFNNAETSASVLEGFKIIRGTGTLISGLTYGGGVYAKSASPTIQRVHVEDNQAWSGAGIYLQASAATLDNVTAFSNGTNSGGTVTSSYGAGISIINSPNVFITNTRVQFNKAKEHGAGIYVYNNSTGPAADFINVLLQENIANKLGGGLYSHNADITLENTVIVGNSAPNNGGGGAWTNGGLPLLRNSIVAHNIGAGYVINDTTSNNSQVAVVEYSLFHQNFNSALTNPYFHIRVYGFAGSNTATGNLIAAAPGEYATGFMDYTLDGEAGIADDFYLIPSAVALNAGNPAGAYNDADATRNDMGIYGGPESAAWNLLQ